MYINDTADAAVDSFTNVTLHARDLATPWGSIRISKFPHWSSHTLIYYGWGGIMGDTGKLKTGLLQ